MVSFADRATSRATNRGVLRPDEWKRCRLANARRVLELDVIGDPVLRNALVPFLQRDTQLEPREVRSEAAVRTAAERDMRHTLDRIQSTLSSTPTFGLLFPCMGRGPYFYGGIDRDLELVKQRYPDMPLIGFYGNGEIGPLDGQNQLYQYAAVLGLFTPHV